MNWWASSVFRGRLGEAIVESILLEFGYKVNRIGQEYQFTGKQNPQRFIPDLLVTDLRNQTRTYVEVKLRTARPMSVQLEKTRIERLRRYYPKTVLIFVSAYNGSINCIDVQHPSFNSNNAIKADHYEFDLFSEDWKPIWHYFPLVKRGKRLSDHWALLKEYMHSFAKNRLLKSREQAFFEDEREALIDYIDSNYDARMIEYNIISAELEQLSLADLWEKALRINAFSFALNLCGEENMHHPAFNQVMDKILGQEGERYLTIPWGEIEDLLKPFPDVLDKYRSLARSLQDSSGKETMTKLLGGLYNMLPPGIGKAFLLPEKGSMDDAIEIDMRTALAISQRRNCLDS